MNKWLQIEDAPINTVILVCARATVVHGHLYEAATVPCRVTEWAGKKTFYDLSDCDRDGEYDHVFPDPTHYQPLPEPLK